MDVSLVRVAFVVAAAAGGVGLAAYAAGLAADPGRRLRARRAGCCGRGGRGGRPRHRPAAARRAAHVPRPRRVVLGRGRLAARADRERRRADLAAVDGRAGGAARRGRARPPSRSARRDRAGRRAAAQAQVAAEGRRTAAAVSRTGLGIALVVAAGFVFLQATGALGAARDVLLAVVAAVVVLGVIFAPWIVRLVRSLTQERPSGSARRSAPRSRPTSTTRCSRRSP